MSWPELTAKAEANGWYATDEAQWLRNCSHHKFEMVQIIWLDTTREDKDAGRHEYVICYDSVSIDALEINEIECAIAAYGYTIDSLRKEYKDGTDQIIAECWMEEDIYRDSCIVGAADWYEKAIHIAVKWMEAN